MTSLTEYTVTFRTDAESAVHEISATSPQAALAEARAMIRDRERMGALCFDPYAELSPIDEITVEAPDGETAAQWLSAELLLRLAAPDLLSALENAAKALNTAPRFDVPSLDRDSYTVATECEQAIAKARQQPECAAKIEGAAS